MSRISHSFVAIGAAAALLALVSWLDVVVLMEARHTAAATFDSSSVFAVIGIASFVVAASCLVLAWLAWRSTRAVGLLYAAVGAVFMLLPWLGWNLNAGAPLPQPMLTAIWAARSWTAGPLNAAGIVGAAMLIVGITSAMRSLRRPTSVDGGSGAAGVSASP